MEITISNVPVLNMTQQEWTENLGKGGFYKSSGGGRSNNMDDIYTTLLKDSISHRLAQKPLQDEPLSEEETIALKSIFEQRIKELLIGRKPVQYGRPTIYFLGQEIKLGGINSENVKDKLINKLYQSYAICLECLEAHKPVYLTIVDE